MPRQMHIPLPANHQFHFQVHATHLNCHHSLCHSFHPLAAKCRNILTLSRAKAIITVNMLCKMKVLRVAGKHS